MFNARVFQLFIASPGDLKRERSAINSIVQKWNVENGGVRNSLFLPRMWEFDLPHGGFHTSGAQRLIDAQLVSGSDACVAMFWSKLGAVDPHTNEHFSVHELRLIRESGLPTYLWVKNSPIPTNQDLSQRAAVDKFVNESRSDGYLTGTFKSLSDLGLLLNRVMDEVVRRADDTPSHDIPKNPVAPAIFSVSVFRSGLIGRISITNLSGRSVVVEDLEFLPDIGLAPEFATSASPGLLSPSGSWNELLHFPSPLDRVSLAVRSRNVDGSVSQAKFIVEVEK